uniref:Uncharacterized protein n=1 Tax=Arundo donax TaxID=35708 RepID=A0A0A9F2C0_ARUDO
MCKCQTGIILSQRCLT